MPWQPLTASATLNRLGDTSAFPLGQVAPVSAYNTPADTRSAKLQNTAEDLSWIAAASQEGFSGYNPQQANYLALLQAGLASETPPGLPIESYGWTQSADPITQGAPAWVDAMLNQAAFNALPKTVTGVQQYAPGYEGFTRHDTELGFNTGALADRWAELAGYRIPQQYIGDDWYAAVDVTAPNWWRDPRALQLRQHKEGSEFGEMLSAAFTIARVAGMISSFGGSNLLGDLTGSLGFGGGGGMDFDFGSLFDMGGGGYTSPGFTMDFDSLAGLSSGFDAIPAISGLSGFEYLPSSMDFGTLDYGGATSGLSEIAGYIDYGGGLGGGGYSPTNIGSYGLFNNPPTPSFFDNASSWFSGNNLSRLASMGSGLYGLAQSKKQRELAKKQQELAARAAAQADPFGPYRARYAQELAALSANPGSITGRPGYQFRLGEGLDAIQRRMAASGYSGSGNEAIAMMRYGQDYASGELNTEMQRLASLAGAQFAPSGGQYLMQGGLASMQGNQAANDLASRALASLGYGLATNNRDLQDIILRSVLQGR